MGLLFKHRVVDSFQGEYRFLSNFYPSPIIFRGHSFPTVENAYQAMKTRDREQWKRFQRISPGAAKRLGRHVFLRDDWETKKVKIMRRILKAKFSKPEMRKKLQKTGERKLVEGNTWGDTFWGVCNKRGENMLGKLLMDIRFELRKDKAK